jgi:Fe-S-cluster containining protein
LQVQAGIISRLLPDEPAGRDEAHPNVEGVAGIRPAGGQIGGSQEMQDSLSEAEEKRRLKRIYRRIEAAGSVPCIEGCHDCCGPVYFSRLELRRAPLLEKNIDSLRSLLAMNLGVDWHFSCQTCVYVTAEGRCGVYKDRPFVCRIFAASDEPALQCPHGRKAPNPISVEETHQLCAEYREIREANARDGY